MQSLAQTFSQNLLILLGFVVKKQLWTNVPTASTATVHSFATNKGSVKYLVRVISGSFSHVTEILATTDASNNVAVVEYGTIYTSENPLATATVVWRWTISV